MPSRGFAMVSFYLTPMENDILASKSVPQPVHESHYFHLRVVLVAQNSCTESAKLTYNPHSELAILCAGSGEDMVFLTTRFAQAQHETCSWLVDPCFRLVGCPGEPEGIDSYHRC